MDAGLAIEPVTKSQDGLDLGPMAL